MCSADIFLGVLAILFPPLPGTSAPIPHHPTITTQPLSSCHDSYPLRYSYNSLTLTLLSTVWVKRGLCSADSLINILLCLLGFIPGLLHAWYIIAKFPEPPYEYEAVPDDRDGGRHGSNRVTYVYVQTPPGPHHQQPKPQDGNGRMNYGTTSQPQQHGVTGSGEGSSEHHQGVPPSYAEVVAGDHKVQTRD
ncbi:hypothetical protein CCMA1212_006940 [Trichoderma ghanense]|uniref:Stress response RCI peptide n=1 Tax=Trichoderma ghanense TaxID=65468 RepID=A0ABY2H133_9HYPO